VKTQHFFGSTQIRGVKGQTSEVFGVRTCPNSKQKDLFSQVNTGVQQNLGGQPPRIHIDPLFSVNRASQPEKTIARRLVKKPN
jgi:hypothetical protein